MLSMLACGQEAVRLRFWSMGPRLRGNDGLRLTNKKPGTQPGFLL
jgi:hypothetical protein